MEYKNETINYKIKLAFIVVSAQGFSTELEDIKSKFI